MERMKLTEKEKEQILKSGAEAMSKIIERMSIEMGELEEENKKLNKELEVWKNANKKLRMHDAKMEYENKKLKEENELLKQCLDKLMFDADVVNVKIHGELGDYVYIRSDKQFKLNVKD